MTTHHVPRRTRLHILPLLDEVVSLLQGTFGEKLLGVYLVGSYAQGLARAESDADFLFILTTLPTAAELATYEEQLRRVNDQWCPEPVFKIDIKYIQNPYSTEPQVIRERFKMRLTGSLIYGVPIEDNVVAEFPVAVIADAFRDYLIPDLPAIPIHDPNTLTRKFARRAKAKYLLRELEWIAVLAGAPLTCTTSEFLGHIKQYAPEHTDNAELCWRLYQRPYIDDADLAELESRQSQIITSFDNHVGRAVAELAT